MQNKTLHSLQSIQAYQSSTRSKNVETGTSPHLLNLLEACTRPVANRCSPNDLIDIHLKQHVLRLDIAMCFTFRMQVRKTPCNIQKYFILYVYIFQQTVVNALRNVACYLLHDDKRRWFIAFVVKRIGNDSFLWPKRSIRCMY